MGIGVTSCSLVTKAGGTSTPSTRWYALRIQWNVAFCEPRLCRVHVAPGGRYA